MIVKELRNFQHLTYEKGETIFNAGEAGKFAYVINSGAIKLYRQDGDEQKVLGFMKPGQVLGEMAIITGEPRAATAEAAEHTEILVVDDNVLRNILNRCLPLVKSLVEQFIFRIRDTEKKIKEGKFNVSAERCNNMEQTLRKILLSTEKNLVDDENLAPDIRALLLSIHDSCEETLQKPDALNPSPVQVNNTNLPELPQYQNAL